jgi:hypothetical protein
MDSVIGVVVGGISQDKMCRFYHFYPRVPVVILPPPPPPRYLQLVVRKGKSQLNGVCILIYNVYINKMDAWN